MGNIKERRRRGNRNSVKEREQSAHHRPAKSSSAVNDNDKSKCQNGYGMAPPSKQTFKPHSTLLVQFTEETPTWYDCGRNTVGRDDTIFSNPKTNRSNTREVIFKYRQQGDEIYNHEVALSRQSASGGTSYSEKDEKWVESTMKRGTLKDRVAAMSVVVGMDCMHKLYALDMLLDLAGCGLGGADAGSVPNSRIGQMASEALSDLFVNTLLPKDRKLISLDSRPLYLYEGDRNLSPRVLLLWRFEEMIKVRFASYLTRYLGRTLAGEDEPAKKNALVTASSLLMQIPEGEEVLLAMIVNKIGDPGRKVASAAGHQLRLILQEHPAMVNVVAREVQQLAHRPHLSPRALYSCVIFLNQLQLSRDDDESSNADAQTEKRAHTPTSLPASLINTYFHLFEMAIKKDEGDRTGSKKSSSKDSSSTSSMKSRLLSALLTGVNRAHPYLPKKDAAMEKHIDTLYRISHTAPPSSATQALMLLFHLAVGLGDSGVDKSMADLDETRTLRQDRFYRALYSKLNNGEMFVGRQITLFFNLLYKAMKYDACNERISAFSKRLLHSVLHLSSSIICGALLLLSEIVRSRPELKREDTSASDAVFDPTKREPRAAFTGKVSMSKNHWELSLLAHHFHPSVSKFTSDSEGNIAFNGDPLKDFALSAFLDKFAFQNPKSLDKLAKQLKRGQSIAERKTGLSGSTALPLNDPSYLESRSVAEEDSFFHKFFMERAKRDEMKGIIRGNGTQKDTDDSDLEDEALNAAEADEMIDDFEGDTDSEEEAFVNQLAEKMMESGGNGKVNYDDEDPDMADWDDLDDVDDDEDDHEEDGERKEESDDYGDSADLGEDAFMDAASSDEDEGGDTFGSVGGGGSDSEPNLPSEFLDEEDSDVSFSGGSAVKSDAKSQKKRKNPTFADAEEYEKLLEEELKKKRHK